MVGWFWEPGACGKGEHSVRVRVGFLLPHSTRQDHFTLPHQRITGHAGAQRGWSGPPVPSPAHGGDDIPPSPAPGPSDLWEGICGC